MQRRPPKNWPQLPSKHTRNPHKNESFEMVSVFTFLPEHRETNSFHIGLGKVTPFPLFGPAGFSLIPLHLNPSLHTKNSSYTHNLRTIQFPEEASQFPEEALTSADLSRGQVRATRTSDSDYGASKFTSTPPQVRSTRLGQ